MRKRNRFLLFLFILMIFGTYYACVSKNADKIEYGSLSDPNILFVGRWDKSDPDFYQSNWGGAYLRVNFTGKSIGIKLKNKTNLVVSIDNEPPRPVEGNNPEAIVQLNTTSLTEGTHTLLVGAAGQNDELSFVNLILEEGAVTYPPQKKLLIEFIGDSNTTGTGPEKISTVNYAWNTAEQLDCDHTQIAFSGISLSTGYGCLEKKIGMDSLYFNLKNYNHLDENTQTPWNFSYTPDMVFIALGTNDQCGSAPDETVYGNMKTFIQKLRSLYPQTQIIVMRPLPKGAYESSISSVVKELVNSGDTRLRFVDNTGWLQPEDFPDESHPTVEGGYKIVDKLAPILKPLIENLVVTSGLYN